MSTRLDEIAERRSAMPDGDYTQRREHDDWGCIRRPDGYPFASVTMMVDYDSSDCGKPSPPFIEAKRLFVAHAYADIGWLLNNARNALAYCDRILSHNPNGAELMFLTEVKRILAGESDGRAEGG